MDKDIPNYFFNIIPLKNIEESKSKVFSSEEEAKKKLIYASMTPLKKAQKVLKDYLMKVYF